MSKKNEQKSVYFNPENPDDARLLDHIKRTRNFSGYVKKLIYRDMRNATDDTNPYDFVLDSLKQRPQEPSAYHNEISESKPDPLLQESVESEEQQHSPRESTEPNTSPPLSEESDPRMVSARSFLKKK